MTRHEGQACLAHLFVKFGFGQRDWNPISVIFKTQGSKICIIGAHFFQFLWICSPKLVGIIFAHGSVGVAQEKEVRAKTPNGHFSHFSDEQSGKCPLDEVAQDTVEVEDEPGEGNPSCT